LVASKKVIKKIAPRRNSTKLNRLHDKRVDCHSLMTTMAIRDYLAMVDQAYQNRGGIDFQREKLRTTSAIRIRRRMVTDIVQGAVLPPVVVGIACPLRIY
jgi:aromatic ring-cleaving dioxygenase